MQPVVPAPKRPRSSFEGMICLATGHRELAIFCHNRIVVECVAHIREQSVVVDWRLVRQLLRDLRDLAESAPLHPCAIHHFKYTIPCF